MSDGLLNTIIAGCSAIIGAVFSQAASFLIGKSRNKVDENATFRKDLLEERHQLVSQIQDLNNRMNVLEKENQDLRMAQVELEKKTGLLEVEKSRYQSEAEATIRHLQEQVEALNDAKA